jgi:hypothetical protein
MTKMNALLLAALTCWAIPSLAQANPINGTWEKASGVRLPGTKEPCEADNGKYVEVERACYISSPDGNLISVGEKLVHVETIFGAAHMREFDGVIFRSSENEVEAREALVEDGKLVSILNNGCTLKISLSSDDLASATPGAECDSGLFLSNAKRTK